MIDKFRRRGVLKNIVAVISGAIFATVPVKGTPTSSYSPPDYTPLSDSEIPDLAIINNSGKKLGVTIRIRQISSDRNPLLEKVIQLEGLSSSSEVSLAEAQFRGELPLTNALSGLESLPGKYEVEAELENGTTERIPISMTLDGLDPKQVIDVSVDSENEIEVFAPR